MYAFLFAAPSPHNFLVPHSVSIDKTRHILYVADREDGRVLSFDVRSGTFLGTITGFGKRVFAAHYSPRNGK